MAHTKDHGAGAGNQQVAAQDARNRGLPGGSSLGVSWRKS
jgi:hypothetical protein